MLQSAEQLANGEAFVLDFEGDHLHDECGVVGMMSMSDFHSVPDILASGAQALQPRGQEAAGIGLARGADNFELHTDIGLVVDVLSDDKLRKLENSHLGVGHVRWATMASDVPEEQRRQNAGPCYGLTEQGYGITLAHNGQINNRQEIAGLFGIEIDEDMTDSRVVTAAIVEACRSDGDLIQAIQTVLPTAEGSFSLVIAGQDQLIAVRDAHGIRPLVLGTYPDGSIAFASETPALKEMGASFEREVAPGEMVVCSKDCQLTSYYPFQQEAPSLCSFEFIYLASADGNLAGRGVKEFRERLGEVLAEERPVDADVIVGVPESGTPASEGYARASGIPNVPALERVVDIRTFIMRTRAERERAVTRKLKLDQSLVEGVRVGVVDDSIVRGTTVRPLVTWLRQAGALEVHLRIASPPMRHSCWYGTDTPDEDLLIINNFDDLDQLAKHLEVDSLAYLSIDGLYRAAGGLGLCMACMDGNYPIDVSSLSKH